MNTEIDTLPDAKALSMTLGPDRSYQKLAAQVWELVVQGEFGVGDRLPAERTLSERFNVSRTAIREAIIALEVQGAVEVRGGSGIYVAQAPSANPVFALKGDPGPFELLRARCLIESEIAAEAALSRKDSDIDRIYAALTTMAQNMGDQQVNDAADQQFHLSIAEATGNSILPQIVAAMWSQRKGPLWKQMESHFHSPAMRASSHQGHQRIFEALLARDASAARAAMREHLEAVMTQFAQAWR